MRSNFGKLLIDEALRGFCVKMLRASEDPSTKPGRDCLHTRHGWIEAVAELIVRGKNHPLAGLVVIAIWAAMILSLIASI